MEIWLNNANAEKKEHSERKVSLCHFVNRKPHTDWSGIKLRPPRCAAGDKPPVPWHGPRSVVSGQMNYCLSLCKDDVMGPYIDQGLQEVRVHLVYCCLQCCSGANLSSRVTNA
jgi:hypothetical protein